MNPAEPRTPTSPKKACASSWSPGVSGARKSTALRALEDVGFYRHNLPLPLLNQFIGLLQRSGFNAGCACESMRVRVFGGFRGARWPRCARTRSLTGGAVF